MDYTVQSVKDKQLYVNLPLKYCKTLGIKKGSKLDIDIEGKTKMVLKVVKK